MSPTEEMLLAVHKSPVVRLADICERYFGKNFETARRAAARHQLPVPVYLLDPNSQKSPWMVSLKDLAAHIDATAEKAKTEWMSCQIPS